MTTVRICLCALLLTACATSDGERRPDAIRIDHVIVGVADLEKGIADFERLTGVRAVVGGVHPGRGTRNALMSLGGGTYLEILAPDPAQSVDNDEIRELRTLARPTPLGWAVSADEERVIRLALKDAGRAISPPEPGSRAKPDGAVLRWVTFGYDGVENPLAPFFIIWMAPDLHPARTSPGGCRLSRLSIETPDSNDLAAAVQPLRLNVAVNRAAAKRVRLSLSCPDGEVRL